MLAGLGMVTSSGWASENPLPDAGELLESQGAARIQGMHPYHWQAVPRLMFVNSGF